MFRDQFKVSKFYESSIILRYYLRDQFVYSFLIEDTYLKFFLEFCQLEIILAWFVKDLKHSFQVGVETSQIKPKPVKVRACLVYIYKV